MKKILAILLALCTVLAFAACGAKTADETTAAPATTEAAIPTVDATFGLEETLPADAELIGGDVMTYEEYAAAEMEAEVTVEAYVQATQSWWDNKITVYAQDADGAYFIYEMACSEEDAAKLTAGTKIRVNGYKGEWAGEVEIMDATFEFVEGADTFVAEALDVTDLLGTDDLIKEQNKLVSFKGLTVKKIEYKNGEPGDDIYVTVAKGEDEYSFCVERYLTDPDTEVYKAVGELKEGDIVDVTGFLYWYEGVNTHITAVAISE